MNFKEYELKDCIELVIDHRGKTPKKLGEDWIDKGRKVISAKHVKGGMLVNKDQIRFISEEVYQKWMKVEVEFGDVLIASEGATLGENMMWNTDEKVALGQRIYAIRSNPKVMYHKYFAIYVNTEFYQNQIFSKSTGTSVLGIKQTELLKTIVKLPSLREQKFIGDLFFSIQEKIDKNNIQRNILEDIAQNIYKHWFIDFEFPNEDGLPYKSSGGKMVESELGEIPKGWEIFELKELTKMYKKTFNPIKTKVENVLHFSLPAFDSKSYPVVDDVTSIKSNKWIVEENCVLFSKMNPSTPRVWLPPIDKDVLNVASSEFVVLKNDTFNKTAFIYNLCKSEPFIEYLKSNATGSTNSRQRITPDNAILFKIALEPQLIVKYGELVESMMNQIILLLKENNRLEELRENLLPKLLSGEIEIPDESVDD